jgi:hypothetical protein
MKISRFAAITTQTLYLSVIAKITTWSAVVWYSFEFAASIFMLSGVPPAASNYLNRFC